MSSVPVQPNSPTVVDLKPTFGWVFIGVIFAAVFYGVTVVQTLFYYQTYPNDRASLKALVLGIWVLDTLSLVLNAHGTYTWLVINFANPLALNNIIWTISSEPLCHGTIALCVHLFMAYRIYMFNQKLVLLALGIALLSFMPFGLAIAATISSLTTTGGGGFAAVNVKIHLDQSVIIISNVSTAALDIVIAATLVSLLRMHGNHFLKRTDRMITILTIYLVTNNLLTTQMGHVTMQHNTPGI